MAKKEKTATKKGRRGSVERRRERRFVAQASTGTTTVRALGGVAALLLGAGVWGYFYAQSFATDDQLRAFPSYLIAAGAVLMGLTIWIGTSSESPVRVGAPGIAVERGEVRRMPWWAVDTITFEPGSLSVVVAGKDESNVDWTFKVPVRTHPEAAGWLVKEAVERIPRRVDIADDTLDKLPAAHEHAGTVIDLEPLQVVGKRCAVTNKTISYEPDARVCPRCERVYAKRSVPKKCKCGNSLVHLQPPVGEGDDPEDTDEDEDDAIDEERASTKTVTATEEESAES